MKVVQKRKRKPKTVWDRPANWTTVSGQASYEGTDGPERLQIAFFEETDSLTESHLADGFRLEGTRAEFEHLQAVVTRLLMMGR